MHVVIKLADITSLHNARFSRWDFLYLLGLCSWFLRVISAAICNRLC